MLIAYHDILCCVVGTRLSVLSLFRVKDKTDWRSFELNMLGRDFVLDSE